MEMSDAMNAEEMIEYVLCESRHLELPERDAALHMGSDQEVRLQRLRVAVQRLVDDGTALEYPPDLARRTVAFVARNRPRQVSLLDYVPVTLPFRWADFAVAASIFIAGVLTLLPAVQRSRERMNQAGCVFNLQQLGNSFGQYASMNQLMPYPPSSRADAPAGSFASMLHDAGVLNDPTLLDCPCNGPCPHTDRELVGFNDLEHIRKTDRARVERMVKFDYAYNIGYP